MGFVGDLILRPAHLVFLALIAALGTIVCSAWLFGIIDATGFVIGMMVSGAAYAVGFLMLWLERSLASEVTNRIESQKRQIVDAINDQIAGVRAQQAGDTCRAAKSTFLAAPRFAPSTTKAVFIGGIISTGSTLLKAALVGCKFATSTGKYEDGRHDPDYPPVWAEGNVDPTAPASEAFQAWVESYCLGPWLIEKTPDRYLHFLAIQKRLGPERSHLLMMQRDPYQTIALIQRRCPERYRLGPGHPPGRIVVDDPGLVRRLRQAIEFHETLRPHLQHFRYVRYEALCADPKRTLSDILGSLGVGVAPRALGRAAALVKQDARRYPITVESDEVRSAATRLCRLWGYPEH